MTAFLICVRKAGLEALSQSDFTDGGALVLLRRRDLSRDVSHHLISRWAFISA